MWMHILINFGNINKPKSSFLMQPTIYTNVGVDRFAHVATSALTLGTETTIQFTLDSKT